jgi:hypothetical protein
MLKMFEIPVRKFSNYGAYFRGRIQKQAAGYGGDHWLLTAVIHDVIVNFKAGANCPAAR